MLKDIKSLEEEKRIVELKFKERTYHYEKKVEVYTKYFTFLDEFQASFNPLKNEIFMPIFREHILDIIEANHDKKKKFNAIDKIYHAFEELVGALTKELNKIKLENNTIKLFASNEALESLTELERVYDKMYKESSEYFKYLMKTLYATGQIEPKETKFEVNREELNAAKKKLTQILRKEIQEGYSKKDEL